MFTQIQAIQRGEVRQPRLGNPKWQDPERRQSIKVDKRAKMEWQLNTSLWTMTCWIALSPAQPCLRHTMDRIEILLLNRKSEVWGGDHTDRGCTLHPSMHGRSIKVAQPTIIISSSSKVCRRNAKTIIQDEKIKVDSRGIGIEFYEIGPVYLAGSIDLEAGYTSNQISKSESAEEKLIHSSGQSSSLHSNSYIHQAESSNKTSKRGKTAINGALVYAGELSCTIGGLLAINGVIYGLTVAHAFESNLETVPRSQGEQTPVVYKFFTLMADY
jgi:hypothetical protein